MSSETFTMTQSSGVQTVIYDPTSIIDSCSALNYVSCCCDECSKMKILSCDDEKYKDWFEIISLYIQAKEIFESIEKMKIGQLMIKVLFRSCLKYFDIPNDCHLLIMKNEEGMIHKILNGEHCQYIYSKCIFEIVSETIRITIVDD